MTLIVEDGTGVPDAESYTSVDYADKYFSDRGVASWASLTTADKERGLRLATDYVELRFSTRFRGTKLDPDQYLSFPRADGKPIPVNLQRACAEYAVRALAAPLVADPVVDDRGLVVKSVSEKLGPLDETTEYATTARELFKPYPAADNLLKSLLRPSQLIR
jgi:hypothetical protein